MLTFLLTSFLAFLIVGFALLIEPPRFGALRHLPGVGYVTLDDNAKLFIRRALTVLVILLVIVAIWLYHGSEISWQSRYVPNFVFGLLFGPLFAIWLSGVFRTSIAEGLGTGQIVLGILLIILFVVGLLGSQTARLADRLGRNVSKIGVVGAEISFTDASRAKRGTEGSAPTATAPPAAQRQGANPSYALNFLRSLDTTIGRDCRYIKLNALVASERSGVLDSKLVAEIGQQQQKQPCQLSGDERAQLEHAFSAAQVNSFGNTLVQFDVARRFAKFAVSDYASCLGGVFDQTLDTGFVQEHLARLVLPLQEALTLLPVDEKLEAEEKKTRLAIENGYVERTSATLAEEAFTLIHDTYPLFLTRRTTGDGADDVRAACAPLLIRTCELTDGEAARWSEMPEEWAKLDKDETIKDCATAQRSPVPAATAAPGDICGQTDHAADMATSREGYIRRYQSRVVPEFCGYLASTKTNAQDFKNRPYLAISYASVMAQLGRYPAGISRLDEWLEAFETAENVADGPGIRKLKGLDQYKLWIALRARSLLIVYTEEWIRSLGDSAWDLLRDFHLDSLSRFFAQLESFILFKDPLTALADKVDLDRDGYRRAPAEPLDCKYTDDLRPTLMYIYLTNKLAFAYNALRHSRYADVYAPLVKAYVPAVMDAPHTCIVANYPADYAGKLRPDALDLQAQVLLRDSQVRRKDSDIEGARDLLNKAKAAATLGRDLVTRIQEPDSSSARIAKSFIDRITVTPPIDASDSLKRTLQTIQNEIDDLDR